MDQISLLPSRGAPIAKPNSIRLIASDIDGTLLNPQFQISEGDLTALRRAHAAGIEIVLVTGRRHTFALPIAQQLGFRFLADQFQWRGHAIAGGRDVSSRPDARGNLPQLCGAMQEFRGNTVLTFDRETKGAIVLERLDELGASIRRWLEKNMAYIEFVVPIEDALVSDPVQTMFCGTMERMARPCGRSKRAGMDDRLLFCEPSIRSGICR